MPKHKIELQLKTKNFYIHIYKSKNYSLLIDYYFHIKDMANKEMSHNKVISN